MTLLVVGLCLGALIVFALNRYGGVLRQRRNRPVVVTMKSGPSFKGVLVGNDRLALVLGHAEAIETEGKHVPVDGEVILPWGDVKYMQRP